MTRSSQTSPITLADVQRITGVHDDAVIAEVLQTGAGYSEIEQAVLWASGEGEFLGKSGHPLQGTAAAVYDILIKLPAFSSESESPPASHG